MNRQEPPPDRTLSATDAYRAVFMGSGSFSLPVLRALLEGGPGLQPRVETVGIVSQPDRPAGRGRRLTPNPVTALARERPTPLLQPPRLRASEALTSLAELRPDVVIVAAYGQILPPSALRIPPHGCLNLHPSLLPRHRGPAPVIGAILAGDERTGTTLMLMTEKMDAGPIIDQLETDVPAGDTAGELEARLAEMSGALLLRNLPAWLEGRLAARPQDEAASTYTRLLSKEDARIDWSMAADEIDRRIRAFDPRPVAHSRWGEQTVRLFRSSTRSGDAEPGRVLGLEGDRLAIGAGSGVVLVAELQLPGGRRVPAADALRGHPDLAGGRMQ